MRFIYFSVSFVDVSSLESRHRDFVPGNYLGTGEATVNRDYENSFNIF